MHESSMEVTLPPFWARQEQARSPRHDPDETIGLLKALPTFSHALTPLHGRSASGGVDEDFSMQAVVPVQASVPKQHSAPLLQASKQEEGMPPLVIGTLVIGS